MYKARVDGVWSNLNYCKVFLLMVGRWNWMIFKILSHAKHSMIP